MDEKRLEACLADLNFIAPDPASAEWLAMYRYWAGMNEEE